MLAMRKGGAITSSTPCMYVYICNIYIYIYIYICIYVYSSFEILLMSLLVRSFIEAYRVTQSLKCEQVAQLACAAT